MTDPLTLFVALCALVLAIVAGVLTLPRPPTLDGERWFAAVLATLRASPDAWEVASVAAQLGDAHDPARWAAGATWRALAASGAGDPAFFEALGARCPWRWVVVRGPEPTPSLSAALSEVVDRVEVPWVPGDPEAAGERVHAALVAEVGSPGDLLCVVGEGEGAHAVLRALVADEGLRDHVVAVVALSGVIWGRAGDGPWGGEAIGAWMARWFGHEQLDTEIVRRIPYVSLAWVDPAVEPPGLLDLPIEATRFRVERHPRGLDAVEPVDLGVVTLTPSLRLDLVARGLVAVVSCWTLSRR